MENRLLSKRNSIPIDGGNVLYSKFRINLWWLESEHTLSRFTALYNKLVLMLTKEIVAEQEPAIKYKDQILFQKILQTVKFCMINFTARQISIPKTRNVSNLEQNSFRNFEILNIDLRSQIHMTFFTPWQRRDLHFSCFFKKHQSVACFWTNWVSKANFSWVAGPELKISWWVSFWN